MQALQYTRALKRIAKEMKVLEIIDLLKPLVASGSNIQISQAVKDQFAILLFGSRAGYERLIEIVPTAKVLESLNLKGIYEPARLGRLVTSFNGVPNSGNIWGSPAIFQELFSFYDQLRSLATLESSCSELLEAEKLGPDLTSDDILELLLIDYDGTGLEPIRLERFISVLTRLHTNFARILGVKDDRLKFIYFDSGSDLLLGIKCAKDIMEGIRTLFGEWWDKIRFRDYDTFDRKMDALSKGLTVMGTVQNAVNTKVLDQATADVLKVRVLREVDDLIGLGASLPVDDDTERVDHRKLLVEKRNTKLLGSGEPPNDTAP